MKPSQTAGLFLATWRAQWARLTRQQLAIAVSAQLGRPRAVDVSLVRRWEDGQPPKTLAELDALCAVMARHGLQRHEARRFRETVFLACVDRHYPDLMADENMAYRSDLEEWARALERAAVTDPAGDADLDVVALVATLHEIDQALLEPSRSSRIQRRQQAVAQCILRTRLACGKHTPLRLAVAADELHRAAMDVARHFGEAGLDPWHSRSGLRRQRLWALSNFGGSVAAAEELLELYRTACDAAGPYVIDTHYSAALNGFVANHMPLPPELQGAQRRLRLAEAEDHGVTALEGFRMVLYRAAIHERDWAQAEAELETLTAWRDCDTHRQALWYECAGQLERLRGRPAEALEYYARGLETSLRWHDEFLEGVCREQLEVCERQQARLQPRRSGHERATPASKP